MTQAIDPYIGGSGGGATTNVDAVARAAANTAQTKALEAEAAIAAMQTDGTATATSIAALEASQTAQDALISGNASQATVDAIEADRNSDEFVKSATKTGDDWEVVYENVGTGAQRTETISDPGTSDGGVQRATQTTHPATNDANFSEGDVYEYVNGLRYQIQADGTYERLGEPQVTATTAEILTYTSAPLDATLENNQRFYDSASNKLYVWEGVTLGLREVSATDGAPGPAGDGFTGGVYDETTGVVTFSSDDGLGFATGDLRGSTPDRTWAAVPNNANTYTIDVTANPQAKLEGIVGGAATIIEISNPPAATKQASGQFKIRTNADPATMLITFAASNGVTWDWGSAGEPVAADFVAGKALLVSWSFDGSTIHCVKAPGMEWV